MVFEEDEPDENVNSIDTSISVDDNLELVDDANTSSSYDTEEDWLEVMRRRDRRNSKLCPLCRRIITAINSNDVLCECCICGEMSFDRLLCFDGNDFVLCHCVCEDCYLLLRTPNEQLQD